MEAKRLIENFLSKKKTEFLEKKVAAEIKGKKDQSEIVVDAARQKHQPEADNKYAINLWFEKAINKAKPNVTTHPAKFTNPKIKNTSMSIFYGTLHNDGYVKTGNVVLEDKFDVSGDAATNTLIFELFELLSLELDEEKTFVNFFETDNKNLMDFIEGIALDYQATKSKCLSVYKDENSLRATHDLIRQVYFPIGIGYHLLSMATASMLMFEVKKRIDGLDKWIEGSHVRKFKSDNKLYPEGFDDLPNLTEIGFSHNEFTKMGNVSYLNVKNKGIAYLLPSLPPSLKPEEVRLPTTDFFNNCLWPNQFKADFESLHKWLVDSRNNIDVRTRRDKILLDVFNDIVQKVWQIRATEQGWSLRDRFDRLPKPQKIILDQYWQNERGDGDQHLDVFLNAMARWIILAYKKVLGNEALPLNDDELSHVNQLIHKQREALL